jgi:hypothetical protein
MRIFALATCVVVEQPLVEGVEVGGAIIAADNQLWVWAQGPGERSVPRSPCPRSEFLRAAGGRVPGRG